MRNRSVTQVLPSAAGQSVDVKQMLVEGNLDGVSGQKCSGARQTVMKQESPVIIFDLTAGVSRRVTGVCWGSDGSNVDDSFAEP